jgi:hypothetical protein
MGPVPPLDEEPEPLAPLPPLPPLSAEQAKSHAKETKQGTTERFMNRLTPLVGLPVGNTSSGRNRTPDCSSPGELIR